MPLNNWTQVLAEGAMVYGIVLLLLLIGRLLVRRVPVALTGTSLYSLVFHQLLAGLFSVISIYAILITQGKTVNLFVPVLLFLLYWYKRGAERAGNVNTEAFSSMPFGSLAFVSVGSVLLLNLFPESEYKQADAFFYLKIAESLNATGQENISHYNNQLGTAFHGMEPYHFFELWITAALTRITHTFFPSILIERFVCYGVVLTCTIVGLYGLVEQQLHKAISVVEKVFCWVLLFILPNLLVYFPTFYKVFISDFEGNLLERPNFRIIYLLLVPVIAILMQPKISFRPVIYLLLLLCVVSFKCTVVVLPALLLYASILWWKNDKRHREFWLAITAFTLGFAVLYLLHPARRIPTLYGVNTGLLLWQTLGKYKFVLFSIVTSAVYILMLVLLVCLPLVAGRTNHLFTGARFLSQRLLLLFILAAVGVVIGRVLFLKDNAYQFVFIAHIVFTLFIWLMYLFQLQQTRSRKVVALAVLVFGTLFLLHHFFGEEKPLDIYIQNGKYVYGGRSYSSQYLRQVNAFFSQHKGAIGGYAASESFYQSLYYSRRNPNVYFLPVTYVVAGNHNQHVEYCLSDSAAIMKSINAPLEKDYLENAINRSAFYLRQRQTELPYQKAVIQFVQSYKLSYFIATKEYDTRFLNPVIRSQWMDENTGERFIVL